MLTTTENGFGKLTETQEYRTQSRGGKGIMTMKVTEKNGPVVGVTQVTRDDDVMFISDQGKLYTRFDSEAICFTASHFDNAVGTAAKMTQTMGQ